MANPLGIAAVAPRLAWKIASNKRDVRQTAYRVLVASTPDRLNENRGDLWDSQKVDSDHSIQIPYAGSTLKSGEICYWKVQVWDQTGHPLPWSELASWEMGLLDPSDWQDAKWLQLEHDTRQSPLTNRELQTAGDKVPRLVESFPSPLFRREFTVRAGLVRARAYVCGLGLHEFFVNGKKHNDHVLDPAQTCYDFHSYYITHDLTSDLPAGKNAVGMMLENGFYGQNFAYGISGLSYGPPVACAKIVLDYDNGRSEVIATDDSWKAETGPVLFDNAYGGETYDARLEHDGWSAPGFDDSHWQKPLIAHPPATGMSPQVIEPMREIETLKPLKVIQAAAGIWIYDFGHDFCGWARIHPREAVNTQITIRYAEALSADGKSLDTGSYARIVLGVLPVDIYVCNGKETGAWEQRSAYQAVRYVEVSGLKGQPDPNFLEAVVVRTDVPRMGSFESSDETLNHLYAISVATRDMNLQGIVNSDISREKCSWLGDESVVADFSTYNYDMAALWEKTMDDIEDVTHGPGDVTYWGVPATPGIPCNIGVGKRLCQQARPDWGDAMVLVCWTSYLFYQDQAILEKHYPLLKHWMEYCEKLKEQGIITKGYGDWTPPGPSAPGREGPDGGGDFEAPVALTSTAYHYGLLKIMEQISTLLGKRDDTSEFKDLAEKTRQAFLAHFYLPTDKSFGSQTGNAIALRFDLFPENGVNDIAAALVHDIEVTHGGHPYVGIHGERPIFSVLDDYGYDKVAFDTLTISGYPGYTWAIKEGLTTWPEQFMDPAKMRQEAAGLSLNTPMHSDWAAWFHESVAGIRPGSPGFKEIVLKPHNFEQIGWIKATYQSPYGLIRSCWQCKDHRFDWEVTVPPNSTALVYVPVFPGGSVSEGGHPGALTPGISFLRHEKGYDLFRVTSGQFTFVSST